MTTPDAGQAKPSSQNTRLIEDLREGIVSKKLFDAAADEIERLRGFEADARRYRFIRSGETHGDVDINVYRHPWFTEEFELLTEDAADTEIDAAIAASRSTRAADVGEDHA